MVHSFRPSPRFVGRIVRDADGVTFYDGGGELRPAKPATEMYEPGWSPMPVRVWHVLVETTTNRQLGQPFRKELNDRVAELQSDPEWDRQWICHPEGYAQAREEFAVSWVRREVAQQQSGETRRRWDERFLQELSELERRGWVRSRGGGEMRTLYDINARAIPEVNAHLFPLKPRA